MRMPAHWRTLRSSCPSSQATIAAATGIIAEKMLDFATPRLLMLLTHSEKARLEHRTVRQISGYHTSDEKYISALKSLIPFHKKRGRR